MKGCRARLTKTSDLLKPNMYAQMLLGKMSDKAFDQEKALEFKGLWRSKVFKKEENYPLDIEIGTGNGYHFADRSSKNLHRGLLGFEIKYKPLIQSINRALQAGAKNNAYMCRFNASGIIDIFNSEEINNVYIHHPDPWPKKKHWKHRLIQTQFLDELYTLMKSESFVEFKTDDRNYFDWSQVLFNNSRFKVNFVTRDLHNSEKIITNFVTHFEEVALSKDQRICFLKAVK